MTAEPRVSFQIRPANKILWAIKTYIDLISSNEQLVYGSGLKRLYVLSNGMATFYDPDITAATEKAIRMRLIPHDLGSFMNLSILKNCQLYGELLFDMIVARLAEIASGDIVNPNPQINWNPVEGRRSYYVPPHTFLSRLQTAIGNQYNPASATSLLDLVNDADSRLALMQGNEGYQTPSESSFAALVACAERLVQLLINEQEARYSVPNYKDVARPCLKILWFMTKLLYGDLTTQPLRKDINHIDLRASIRMTDGTLAALPFPIRQTLNAFWDEEVPSGITMKARRYLDAVSNAAFYRLAESEG